MLRILCSFALALTLVACDDGDPTDAGPGGTDSGSGTMDAGPGDVDAGDTDAGDTDAGDTDAGSSSCGDQRPDISGITGTEGVVIARDGTIYYSQSGAVGRLAPGGAPENRWVDLSGDGATTIWGMVPNAANDTLYVGSPGNGRIYVIDVAATTFTTIDANSPNGLTIGPDGALYWSEFGMSRVRRNDLTGGASTTVTTSPIQNANGVAFADDGTLYVASYSTGNLFQLTLTDGAEIGRTMAASGLGSPDGVAFDENGDIYVTDNGGGTLMRVVGGTPTTIDTGITAAASVEFGAGPLTCTDIYVASAGPLRRYEMGVTAGRAVPWH